MFSEFNWNKPQTWHQTHSAKQSTVLERAISISFFAGLTALCAQIAFTVPWTPVPYTFQTFAVLATGVYLRRNDARSMTRKQTIITIRTFRNLHSSVQGSTWRSALYVFEAS